jgi:hypothetical protein
MLEFVHNPAGDPLLLWVSLAISISPGRLSLVLTETVSPRLGSASRGTTTRHHR